MDESIVLQTNNRQTLQAALTALIQQDRIVLGSVVEIVNFSIKSNLILELLITSNQSCVTPICMDDYEIRVNHLLSSHNQTTFVVSYEYSNRTSSSSTNIVWLQYQLPDEIQSST